MQELKIIQVEAAEWDKVKANQQKIIDMLETLTTASNKKYLTVKEAAELLKVTTSTIHRYLANGTITAKERTAKRQKILIRADQLRVYEKQDNL